MDIIKSQDAKTGDISVSFFRNRPPKNAPNKLYEFKTREGVKVEIFAEDESKETLQTIVDFVRAQFGIAHPDPKSAEWFNKNFGGRRFEIKNPVLRWFVDMAGLMVKFILLFIGIFGIPTALLFVAVNQFGFNKYVSGLVIFGLYFLALYKMKIGQKYLDMIGRISKIN